MSNKPLTKIELTNLSRVGRGKVRDIFSAGDNLLLVATDRISAFDFVLQTPIPGKGDVLTGLSLFWFDLLKDIIPNQLVTDDMTKVEGLTTEEVEILQGRSLLVKKAEPLPAEFIVRGYLTGSGWKDYQKTGMVCGIKLPLNMRNSDRLKSPILTPSTKADEGHDENITVQQLKDLVGNDIALKAEEAALGLYCAARDHALSRGIILCDTKFEFGIYNNELILIDEVLTPDSSRFWPKDKYEPGKSQESFDKQYVRDYLLTCDWDRNSPPPPLPDEVVSKTASKYEDVLKKLTK